MSCFVADIGSLNLYAFKKRATHRKADGHSERAGSAMHWPCPAPVLPCPTETYLAAISPPCTRAALKDHSPLLAPPDMAEEASQWVFIILEFSECSVNTPAHNKVPSLP